MKVPVVLGPASVVSLEASVSFTVASGASFDPVSTSSEAVEAIEEILIPNPVSGSLSSSRLSEAVEAIEEILIPNSSEGSLVRNIWFFSPLVPSKREKNILVSLSLYIFLREVCYDRIEK